MTKLIGKALKAVRQADAQDQIAREMLYLSGADDRREPMVPAYLAAVLEGLAQFRRGDPSRERESDDL